MADVTFETAFLKNWGSVKVTPAGNRSVRFREAKFFSRRVACMIDAHSENMCSGAGSLHNPDKFGVVESHSLGSRSVRTRQASFLGL